jgi:hypothetical protein
MTASYSSPVTPGPAPAPRRSSFRKWFWLTVLAVIAIFVLYTFLMLSWSYSDGERAGVLQKFSQRGWICKTYEGELAMYVVAGVGPQIWNFSVRDESIVDELNAAMGEKVRLHYAEHRGLPTNCFGETDYFVDRVEIVADSDIPSASPTPASP